MNRRNPRKAGIYLAKLKGAEDVVAVVVSFWRFGPGNKMPPGYYAKSWSGENCHAYQGSPFAVPMKDHFASWALAHTFAINEGN